MTMSYRLALIAVRGEGPGGPTQAAERDVARKHLRDLRRTALQMLRSWQAEGEEAQAHRLRAGSDEEEEQDWADKAESGPGKFPGMDDPDYDQDQTDLPPLLSYFNTRTAAVTWPCVWVGH